MKLVSASFFWRNDEPIGLGVTFSEATGFSPAELDAMFKGSTVAEYFRASDEQLGTQVVECYLDQLRAIAAEARRGPLPVQQALLAALNIMWLTERGFMPNNDHNGPMFTYAK